MSEPSAMAAGYEVYAIRYCHREALRYEHFYQRVERSDESMAMDYFIWLVKGPAATVVVDTGYTLETSQARGRRDYLASPLDTLESLGVTPGEVDTVVLTHLHFDHTGNVRGFPESRFIVQESEMAFWCGRHAGLPDFARLCNAADLGYLVTANLNGRVRMLDGDAVIAPGISVHHLGGHTPGTQVVCVDTRTGPVVLASDASHYFENVEARRPYSIVHNLPAVYDAFDRIHELAGPGGRIVAGHDPKVLSRFSAPSPRLEGLVVQIA